RRRDRAARDEREGGRRAWSQRARGAARVVLVPFDAAGVVELLADDGVVERPGVARRRGVDLAPHLVVAAAERDRLVARPRRSAGHLGKAARVAGVGVRAADELRRALGVDARATVAAVEEEVGGREGLEVRG